MTSRVAVFVLCASTALAQRPSESEASAIFERARERALAYARSLPDFVCNEVIHRFSETRRPRRLTNTIPTPVQHRWVPADKLTVRLRYAEHKEDHKLILVDDKPTDLAYEKLSGGTGSGEFGGTLVNIFSPEARTSFKWQSWKTVRRHRAAVFSYTVDVSYSNFLVANGVVGDTHEAIVGFHGDLEVDRDTGEILHFSYIATQIPQDVGLDLVSTIVDYDSANVGGRSYLLPSHSAIEMISPRLSIRNDVVFRDYGKFSSDSTIDFAPPK